MAMKALKAQKAKAAAPVKSLAMKAMKAQKAKAAAPVKAVAMKAMKVVNCPILSVRRATRPGRPIVIDLTPRAAFRASLRSPGTPLDITYGQMGASPETSDEEVDAGLWGHAQLPIGNVRVVVPFVFETPPRRRPLLYRSTPPKNWQDWFYHW